MKHKETKHITRREAIKKTGKYAAATAAATYIILSPKHSQADSPAPPGWGQANPGTTDTNQEKENQRTNKA